MAKKSKVDVGKGFKRIYFVIAALWVAFVILLFGADFSFCIIHADKMGVTGELNRNSYECLDYNAGSQVLQLFIFGGLVIPLYYFLRWIAQGFKKK